LNKKEISMHAPRFCTLALGAALAALVAAPADAAVRVSVAVPSGIDLVQGATDDAKGKGKADKAEKGKKAAKNKETGKGQSSERSNASGEVRGQERSQEVQGMQDSGKGSQQRGQRPSK
jgi:hypothetical protein